MVKIDTSDKIRDVLKNKDVVRTIKWWKHKKGKFLDDDEWSQITLRAAQRTVENHDEARRKLSGSYNQFLSWEVDRYLGSRAVRDTREPLQFGLDPDSYAFSRPESDPNLDQMWTWVYKYLPHGVRETVVGHFRLGKTLEEVAISQDVSMDTVVKRIKFAVKKLQEVAKLEGEIDEEV